MERKKRIGYLLVALAITLACVPGLPSVAPLPTQPVGAVDTIVAGTYAAASTGTAVNMSATPTLQDTLTPSNTPTITPTATATIIFKTPTPLPITLVPGGGSGGSGGGSGGTSGTPGGSPTITYECKVLKTSPGIGAKIARGKNFKATWRLLNSGNVVWDRNSVDYLYQSGTPMHTQALYDLPTNVAPTKQVEISVSMQAPKTRGNYSTTWTLRVGDEYFCSIDILIVVD